MAESQEILNDVVSDRAPGTTTMVVNLRTGQPFQAEIEGPLEPIVLMSELGKDLREVCKLHIQGNVPASQLNLGDKVRFTLYGLTSTHTVLDRRQDSGDPLTVFWVQKQAAKDSQ
jgi:hypothetical protein